MNIKIGFFIIISFLTSAKSFAADSCNEYRGKLDFFLGEKYKNKRIMKISDLENDSAASFKSEKNRENPGCVCTMLDGASKSCAVILVQKNKKGKIGPSLVVVNVEKKPIFSEETANFNWYDGGKAAVYLLPKKKSLLENHGQEGPDKIQMPHDGIQLVAPGKSSYVFYYEKDKIKEVWLSD